MNYFELFGLPVSMTVNKDKLVLQYFALQKKYHPDFFTQGTEAEQEEALEMSSMLNKALKTLRDDEAIIKYVLQLKGLMEEEEKYQLPPAFLMEMMELNEELSASTGKQIAELEKAAYAEVASIIANYDENATSNADLLKVKEYYFKKKYLRRILDRIAD